jgi:23S rRNA (pseudouridine1915-N3)-methyltransferase
MMTVELIVVGKLKEPYLREAQEDWQRRLSKICRFSILEVKDEKTREGASEKEMQKVKNQEGEGILRLIHPQAQVLVLDLAGKKTDSPAFKGLLQDAQDTGRRVQLVIGGSLGLSEGVLARAHHRISFGEMTYPHQLFRWMLLEEIHHALNALLG